MEYYSGATEKEALAKAKDSGWQDEFVGMNCNDWLEGSECWGWDGESRRCECGNRRVDWTCEEQKDGTWVCYAEAW